ncbi:MAG: amidophosphoribosyltransferase [Firmicutes bacterium]|nr:amidophosphoribosyltransferase [Bacillota bacterium]
MGGFFGAVSGRDIVLDVFFGTDYHSHLGTASAGMAVWDAEKGIERQIHNIGNTPFRTKFEGDLPGFSGTCGIGCVSDSDPQPLVFQLRNGMVALATVGVVNNAEELVKTHFLDHGRYFTTLSNGKINVTDLVAGLVNEKEDMVEGIKYASDMIEGSMSMLFMTGPYEIIACRDKKGRLSIHIGKNHEGYCVSFESFAYSKLSYEDCYELGPGEVVRVTKDGFETLSPPGEEMKICAFLWAYYGYPNSNYEGVNVELMRYRNGIIMAKDERARGTLPDVDFVAGIPDSGVPHAIGYANASGKPFARPLIKYTPTWYRSFMPANQGMRNQIAKMKQIPIPELIEGMRLLFVDDSIVRGTQLRETVEFLYSSGAKEVHMRSACPPIMYSCKFLNFSRNESEMDLLARRTVQALEGDEGQKHLDEYSDPSTERGKCLLKAICDELGFDSLGYQTIDGLLDAIGLDRDKVCTYCWTGKE